MESSMKAALFVALLSVMVQLGYSITCEMGGTTPETVLPKGQMDCTTSIGPVSFMDKCFVMLNKNSTNEYISYGCLVNETTSAQMCGSDLKFNGMTVKGCCCETELCNNKGFRDRCTGAASATTSNPVTTTTTTTVSNNGKNNNNKGDIDGGSMQQTGSLSLTLFVVLLAVVKEIFN